MRLKLESYRNREQSHLSISQLQGRKPSKLQHVIAIWADKCNLAVKSRAFFEWTKLAKDSSV